MKAKTKQTLYLILGILGLVLAAVAKFLPAQVWNKTQIGAVIGVGAGLFSFGLVKWWVERWNEKNPEIVKQNEIERKDERNQLIRSKAQALSGEILHWLLMGGACHYFRCTSLGYSCFCGSVPSENGSGPCFYSLLSTQNVIGGNFYEFCYRAFV